MPCEEYREALIEMAANGPMPDGLRFHLEACASCRETLQEEQELFAAVDSGVQRMANAEVPPSLLPRVRAGLDQEASERWSFWPYAVLAGAAACAALIFIVVQEWPQRQIATPVAVEANRENPETKAPETFPAQVAKAAPSPSQQRVKASHAAFRPTEVAPSTVLVPVGQKDVVDKLLIALRSGTLNRGELRGVNGQAASADLSVLPLSIAPIEMKPLETVGEDADAAVEKTKF